MEEQIIHDVHWLMFWCFWSGFLMAISIFLMKPKRKKRKNACDCGDPNQCDKWCNAKIKFTKDHL